jgi:hypothetical protein
MVSIPGVPSHSRDALRIVQTFSPFPCQVGCSPQGSQPYTPRHACGGCPTQGKSTRRRPRLTPSQPSDMPLARSIPQRHRYQQAPEVAPSLAGPGGV